MEVKNSTDKPGKKRRKVLLVAALSLMAILVVSHFVWRMSGSNQWELERDKNGIKMWTLKTPGSTLTKLKLVMRVRSKLAGMIKLIEDPSSCPDVGCKEIQMFDNYVLPSGFFSAYYSFKVDLPFPFTTREFVMLIQHSQDRQSKKIDMSIFAAPNKIPPIEDVVRVTHMNNYWQLTPLENGEIAIEYYQDSNIGGSVPYFVNNLIAPEALYQLFVKFQELMGKEKFKSAKFDYVKEL